MGGKWRKVLSCIQAPRTLGDSSSSPATTESDDGSRRVSDAVISISTVGSRPSPLTPTPCSNSSTKNCAICLSAMIPGKGLAIFTAECSHSFHYNCIASNVKHGNRICPVCRAKWKEVPFQSSHDSGHLRLAMRARLFSRIGDEPSVGSLRPLSLPQPGANRSIASIFHLPEPDIFDDDDLIERQDIPTYLSDCNASCSSSSIGRVGIRTYPEVPSVPKSASFDDFTVLIHLRAPVAKLDSNLSNSPSSPSNFRAPVDLVTVLDVSGSMAGTKLALLKRAMGFVIQNLGPHDRLSVISFSSSARRVFPLRRMTDMGRFQALQAVNSLSSNGGTNIVEGLNKGAKVMLERKFKNPVSSIILLSDGQDTYTVPQSRTDYKYLLPVSIQGTCFHIPVHTFGFGTDHDSCAMHSISECSGGMFSFIEAEAVIQDAFAQCMGGLLSVVAQELKVEVECADPGLYLCSLQAGSYQTRIMDDSSKGVISIGDLYAEEERDIILTLNIPKRHVNEMSLIRVSYSYKDPVTKETLEFLGAEEVKIRRTDTAEPQKVSLEVDRQRNRFKAAEYMSTARTAAEMGDLERAVAFIDKCRETISESISSGDPLCVMLGYELKEIQERMANRQVYEASGRAYLLSGLSSHSWQRAAARGDFTSGTNLSQVYQTSSMTDMITLSQTPIKGGLSSSLPPVRPPRSSSGRSRAR